MDKKKKDRLYSLLEKRGIQRASDYYDGDKPKKPKYKDIVEVVPGAKRISNDFGEIVYRKLNVPVSDDPEGAHDRGYRLPGERYISTDLFK